jgi:hypothetical protein
MAISNPRDEAPSAARFAESIAPLCAMLARVEKYGVVAIRRNASFVD